MTTKKLLKSFLVLYRNGCRDCDVIGDLYIFWKVSDRWKRNWKEPTEFLVSGDKYVNSFILGIKTVLMGCKELKFAVKPKFNLLRRSLPFHNNCSLAKLQSNTQLWRFSKSVGKERNACRSSTSLFSPTHLDYIIALPFTIQNQITKLYDRQVKSEHRQPHVGIWK